MSRTFERYPWSNISPSYSLLNVDHCWDTCWVLFHMHKAFWALDRKVQFLLYADASWIGEFCPGRLHLPCPSHQKRGVMRKQCLVSHVSLPLLNCTYAGPKLCVFGLVRFFNNKFAVKYKGRKVKSKFYPTVLRFLKCKSKCLGEKLACLVRTALSNKVTGAWW